MSITVGAVATSGASFGAGLGLIGLNNLRCTGTELMLSECSSDPTLGCSHLNDIGVQCLQRMGEKSY